MHYQGLYPIYTANTSKKYTAMCDWRCKLRYASMVEIPHCSVGTVGRRPQGPKAMTMLHFTQ